jgi:hypothetical protein
MSSMFLFAYPSSIMSNVIFFHPFTLKYVKSKQGNPPLHSQDNLLLTIPQNWEWCCKHVVNLFLLEPSFWTIALPKSLSYLNVRCDQYCIHVQSRVFEDSSIMNYMPNLLNLVLCKFQIRL